MRKTRPYHQKATRFLRLKHRQSGYALVMGLMLLGVMSLSIIGLYNSGQLTSEKMRQQNAADAAAYSLATLSARNLNFISYTNRAMVANQVAIGQMVGLASWAKMLRRAAVNLGTVLQFFPGIGTAIGNVLKQGGELLDNFVEQAVKIFIPIIDFLIGVLSGAQYGVHAGIHLAMPSLFTEVRKSNDPKSQMNAVVAGASIIQYARETNNFVQQARKPRVNAVTKKAKWELARFDEFGDVAQESRDEFTLARSYNWLPRVTIIPAALKVGVRKYGGSEFGRAKGRNADSDKYVWQWTSMDTVGVEMNIRYWKRFKGWKWTGWEEIVPMGWGAAHALYGNSITGNSDYNYRKIPNCRWPSNCSGPDETLWGDGAWRNGISANLANSQDRNNNLTYIKGLRKFFDLKKEGHITRGPALTVLLEKPLNKVKTWNRVLKENQGQAGSRTDIEKYTKASAKMYALAKAEPYFSRAQDLDSFKRLKDKKREYGNLYNPYWQPRLIGNSRTEKAVAYALGAI
jgi:hypothetical protein